MRSYAYKIYFFRAGFNQKTVFLSNRFKVFCNPGKIFYVIFHIVLFSQNYGVIPPDNFFPADLFQKLYEFFDYFLFMRNVFFYILCIRCNCELK